MTKPRCECTPDEPLCYWCAHRRQRPPRVVLAEPFCTCFESDTPCDRREPPDRTESSAIADAKWLANLAAQESVPLPRGRIVEPWEPLPSCPKCGERPEFTRRPEPALSCWCCGWWRRVEVVSG